MTEQVIISFEEMEQQQEALANEVIATFQNEGSQANKDFLKIVFSAEGQYTAQFRFLPHGPIKGPVRYTYREHNATINGKYYSTICPNTYGEPCPLCDMAWEFHRTGNTDMRKKLLSREHHVSYVYVTKSPMDPSVEGTIKLYRYGNLINEMIKDLTVPKSNTVKTVNPFSIFNAPMLNIKVKKMGNTAPPKFDGTHFSEEPVPLKLPKGVTLKEVWEKIPPLAEFPSKYLSPVDKNTLALIADYYTKGGDVAASTGETNSASNNEAVSLSVTPNSQTVAAVKNRVETDETDEYANLD